MTKKYKKTTEDNGKTYSFEGTVLEIRYYSEDSSWGKLKVKIDPTHEIAPMGQSRYDWNETTGKTEEVVVVNVLGKMPKPEIGMKYEFTAKHSYNEKYREEQFDVSDMKSAMPKTINDQVNFLRAIVTENQARSLLSIYPNIVEMVMNGDEVDLTKVDGIKEATFEKIQNKILENFAIGDILSLLVPIGISLNKIRKLLDGEKNVELLKQKLINNPYVLVEIPGISFAVADKIATQLNPTMKISEGRLMAFCRHYLKELGDSSGDTWTTIDNLKNEIIKNVGDCEKFFTEDFIANENIFHIDGDRIGLMSYYRMERYIWEKLIELDKGEPLVFKKETILKGIENTEEKQGFKLTDEQVSVVRNILSKPIASIVGLAGTGKTTITKTILNILWVSGYIFNVATFSAKAAQRSKQVTGFESTTIHKMLDARGLSEFGFNESSKMDVDFVILDEASMISTFLFYSVLKAIDTSKTKLILVGDSRQLPPLSAGNTFYDIVEKNQFNVNYLTKIQRQAESSAIITDANKIRNGSDPLSGNRDAKTVHGNEMFYLFREDREVIFSIAVQSYLKSVAEKGVENVVLLSTRKQGTLNCSDEFNKEIQRLWNDENKENKIIFGKKEFRMNDRVLHLVNNSEKRVFNGETGTVRFMDIPNKTLSVEYDDGKLVTYIKEDLKELDLGFSYSVHKIQGGEAKDVILVLDNAGYVLLSNAIFYTGVTRAKERCLVISQQYAFDRALEENKNVRNTWTMDFEYVK